MTHGGYADRYNGLSPTQVRRRQAKVRQMLKEGWSAAEVAHEVGLSRKRVFDLARKENLPTNPPVPPGSKREQQILRALLVMTVEEVGRLFRTSKAGIEHVVEEVKAREQEKLGRT